MIDKHGLSAIARPPTTHNDYAIPSHPQRALQILPRSSGLACIRNVVLQAEASPRSRMTHKVVQGRIAALATCARQLSAPWPGGSDCRCSPASARMPATAGSRARFLRARGCACSGKVRTPACFHRQQNSRKSSIHSIRFSAASISIDLLVVPAGVGMDAWLAPKQRTATTQAETHLTPGWRRLASSGLWRRVSICRLRHHCGDGVGRGLRV